MRGNHTGRTSRSHACQRHLGSGSSGQPHAVTDAELARAYSYAETPAPGLDPCADAKAV
jgi:hypothetical protein